MGHEREWLCGSHSYREARARGGREGGEDGDGRQGERGAEPVRSTLGG